MDHLLGYIEKILSELNPSIRKAFLPVVAGLLPESLFHAGEEVLPAGFQPYSPEEDRPGPVGKNSGRGRVERIQRLLSGSLRAAYEYWLREEDPRNGLTGKGPIPPAPGK